MAFSWVPFYRELAERVLEFEDKQDELLAILREMKEANDGRCVPLLDNQPDDTQKPLEEIDPFTFMANLARVETATATRLCSWFKQKWDLSTHIPTDFDGRADIQPRSGNSWFFGSVRSGRRPGDVGRMWTLARQAFEADIHAIDFELLQTCMNQNNVGFYKLTKGLSWFSPKGFLPLNDTMFEFLKGKGVQLDRSAIKRGDANEYLKALKGAEKLQTDFLSLVVQAQKTRSQDIIEDDEIEDIMPLTIPKTPLNQILYGPPGTGKTFNVVRRAVRIIEPGFNGDFKTRFEELRAAGQIGFVTFHQSFSYEEFIEGLRPVITDKVGEVRYEIRDGILKTMAKNATQSFDAGNGWSFDFAWKLVCDWVANNPGITIEGRSAKSRFALSLGKARIWGANIISPSQNNNFRCLEDTARKSWDGLKNKADITGYDVQKFEQNVGAEGAFHAVILNKMRDLVKEKNKVDNFVLIIDEINRGNISKILGELITLLEDDKRLGADNELRLTLPVSGETFALPPNLFILGTMNTADKSLAQLDVALRRRFSFIEMAPDFSEKVCPGLPSDIRAVLEKLNERIEWAIDREHRLGHASWMNVKNADDFNRVWSEKAMPLLVELFADNLEGLRELLGDGDNQNGFMRPFKAPGNMKGRDRLRLYLDCPNADSFDALATLKKNLEVA